MFTNPIFTFLVLFYMLYRSYKYVKNNSNMPLPALTVFSQLPIMFSYVLFGLGYTCLFFVGFFVVIGINHLPEVKNPIIRR